jgi:LacI family transcriptional regulator
MGEAGIRVPQDVRVVGMDDTELAALSTPSLSSVSLGAMERGMLAGRLLVERLAHPELAPRRRTVPPQLIVRESSRPPGGSADGSQTGSG